MKNVQITGSLSRLSCTRATGSALLIAAIVTCFGLSATPGFAFANTNVGPINANIKDAQAHVLCTNGVDPATCTDGVVRTNNGPPDTETWTVNIKNTSNDTWKDFHITIVSKENAFGGAYLSSGTQCQPLLDPTFFPAKSPHPQAVTCLKSNKPNLNDTWVKPQQTITLTISVLPYASTKDRPIVATNYHFQIQASTDGMLPKNLVIGNSLRDVGEPMVVGQPFAVSGEVTNADSVGHIVYFKSYGVNALVAGTPTPFAIGPGESVPYTLQVTAQQDGWVALSMLTWSEATSEGTATRSTVYVQVQQTK